LNCFSFVQVKIQKHEAFEEEVTAHHNAVVRLDEEGAGKISREHFASVAIQVRFFLSLIMIIVFSFRNVLIKFIVYGIYF
jgi:hypothetical protein